MQQALTLETIRSVARENPRARRRLARCLYHWMRCVVDPLHFYKGLAGYVWLLRDWRRYAAAPGAERLRFIDSMPQTHDRTVTTPFDSHYFFLNGWAMRRILALTPSQHVDIGSAVQFANLLGAIVPTCFVDYRPLPARCAGLESVAGDITSLPFADASLGSLSCLHVAEHIGLGRYGDPLDPHGTRKAAAELTRVLAPGGSLFFGLPVGIERTCFNAHRIHAPETICRYFSALDLVEFSGVHDDGRFVERASLGDFGGLHVRMRHVLVPKAGASLTLRRLAPEAALIGTGQIVAALASIATIRGLTGILRPEAYGQFGLALTVATLAQQCLLGPIAMAAVRYYAPSSDAHQIGGYARGILILCALGTLTLAVITATASIWIPNLWIAAVYAWASCISSLLDGVQNAARQRSLVALHQGAGAWLRLALAIWAAKLCGGSSTSTLWAYSAGYLVLIASQSFFLWRTLRPEGALQVSGSMRPLATSMACYAWPFSTWGVFTWVQASADRWALNAYSGLYQTGLYQSLYQLGYYPASLLTQFLLQVATPILFAKSGRGNAERWNNHLLMFAIAATLTGGAISAAGGHRLLALLLAPAYREQSALLTPLILASGFFAAGQIGAINSMMSMNTHRLIAPKIITALGGAALILVGTAAAGTKGIVAAQLCFSVAYLAWILVLNRRTVARTAVPNFALNG